MPYKNYEDRRRNDREYRAKRKEAAGIEAPFLQPMVNIKIPGASRHGLRIAVIPDVQVRPGVPVDHLIWAGKYLAKKQPDVIVQIGDFGDLISLNRHNEPGSLQMEGKRYKKDVDSIKRGMELFVNEIDKVAGWTPKKYLTLGNHEDLITRKVKSNKEFEGLISIDNLQYKEAGWEVYPFLQPITIGGVAFCHYFPSGVMGKPITSAKQVLSKLHMSAYAGHQQGRDIAYSKRADGKDMTAIISGSFYQHAEEYLSPFTNNHWRGMYFLHEVKDGSFDEMAVSMGYLKRRFNGDKFCT